MKYAGWAVTVLVVLFLLMDAGMKVAGVRAAMDATTGLGFEASQVRVLGWILLMSTLLYCVPQTSLIGAILVTAYLGGAVAINFQHRTPVASHLLFGGYVGIMVWGGLFLRSPSFRSLFPWFWKSGSLAGGEQVAVVTSDRPGR